MASTRRRGMVAPAIGEATQGARMGGAFGPLLLFGSMLALIALGLPIACAIGVAALIGAFWVGIPLKAVLLKVSDGVDNISLSNHRKVAPFGLDGGEPGALGRQWVERADSTTEKLPGGTRTEVAPGDVFVIQTPAGGGCGRP